MVKALINGINSIFTLFYIVILVRCLLSFFPNIDWYKQPFFTIRQVTDAYLNIFRKIIPPIGMIDISPIIAIIALGVIQNLVIFVIAALFYH